MDLHSRLGSPPSFLLEVAVASLDRALTAERAGAHRLELCERLEVGGLTPHPKMVREVRAAVQIPIHVLVRPRAGDFVYSSEEFAIMKSEITALKQENVQGIAVGVLEPGHCIDLARTRELVDLAAPLLVTFHRAFDETPDPAESLESVIQTGARRILTSGGAPDAVQGAPIIASLIEQAAGRILVLAGGGLHPANIGEVARATGAAELHTGLGSVLPYNDPDSAKCESAIRACVAALVIRRNDNSHNTGFPPPP